MNRLLNIGFINVGHWTLNKSEIKYHLISNQTTKNVLYSFVTNGTIKYIGKTSVEFARRMYGYQNPGPSQSTNIRVNGKIKELLKLEQPVDIFILVENGLLKYGEFKINIAAGLEDTLIYQINPNWNFAGKNKLIEDTESENEKLIPISNTPQIPKQKVESFEIKLGEAYYNQGFFNVAQKYSNKIGADKSVIEIQLGNNSKNTIQGYINRTANKNSTPRIMGGKALLTWIQKNYKQGDTLLVDIISEVILKLNLNNKNAL